MNPIYVPNVFPDMYDVINNSTPWIRTGVPRTECFMSLTETPLTYQYAPNQFYTSVPMTKAVEFAMQLLNNGSGTEYDICFLNKYLSEKDFLGWHADDSPEMDKSHPIASVSFGAEREIWVKTRDHKGEVPSEDRYLLESGSCFIMPAGFQDEYLHRIPKHHRECGERISLTFRKYESD